MQNNSLNLISKSFAILIGLISIIAIWYLIILLKLVPTILLPTPKDVFKEVYYLLRSQDFWVDVFMTVTTWVLGIIIGTIFGVIFGVILGLNKYIWAAIEPLIEFLRSLPSVVLVPLISLFFGVGVSSRLACSIIVVSVILISSTGIAIRSTNATHMRLAKSWKVNFFQRVVLFIAPSAFSHMLIALKIAIPIALIVTVAADMLIATESGLGKIIMDSLAVFNISKMYAAIFFVGILGYFSALISNALEKITIHWSGK